MPTIAFFTLGCKVNQYDTDALIAAFKERGYDIVDFNDSADIYVVNTCTVTSTGDKKSRQILRRKITSNPEAIIVATGCYAQSAPNEIQEIDGVHIITGTSSRAKLVDMVEEAFENKSFQVKSFIEDLTYKSVFEDMQSGFTSEKTRAYIKIQDGCDSFCSYCRVPYVRGRVRSRELGSIIEEAQKLAEQNAKEIVLTGIHLSLYGKDKAYKEDLAYVLDELSKIEKIERIRLSSIDPSDVDDRLISRFKTLPKLCNHVHMALQSGDDTILKSMNRKYSTEHFIDIADKIREANPKVAFTTDVIVGFPGETDEAFENTLNFVEKVGFSKVHVFMYSKRANTPASIFPNQIQSIKKHERSRKLLRLAAQIAIEYNKKKIDVYDDIIVERIYSSLSEIDDLKGSSYEKLSTNDCIWAEGITRDYVRTFARCKNVVIGDLIAIRPFEATENFLLADLID